MGAERNYARFYSLLKKLPGADKETLVEQYTNGRTVHLHRTTMQEYNKMCNDMEQVAGYDERMHRMHEALWKARSGELHQMQLYGIDTADWIRVNAFCRDPRIAGKEFRKLDVEELNALNTKMRTIIRKQKSNQ